MKELVVIFSSAWKFAATFPVAIYLFKMSHFETILYTNIGGIIGIIAFTLISKGIIRAYNILCPNRFWCRMKPRRVFTKKNRLIIKIKQKYGLFGIILLTHVLLSIPVGVFLNTKYYGKKKASYLFLFLAQIAWSFLFTFLFTEICPHCWISASD